MRVMVLVVIAACSDHDGGGGNTAYVGLGEIEAKHRIAECTRYVRCGVFPDMNTCTATNLGPSFMITLAVESEVLEGRLRYDGARVASCFAAVANASCSIAAVGARDDLGACVVTAFKAVQLDNQPCTNVGECVSGVCSGCDPTESCCAGTCTGSLAPAPTSDLPLGSACAFSELGDPCASGSHCVGSHCAALAIAGDTCGSNRDCGDGLTCQFGLSGAQMCAALPGLGQSCVNSRSCDRIDNACNGSTCVVRAVAGQPDADPTGCMPFVNFDSISQTCVARPHLGESCQGGITCGDADSYCEFNGEVCLLQKANGQECSDFTECLSSRCDDATNTCVAVTSGCP